MKKLISIMLSVFMLIGVCSATAVAYAAKNPIYSPETTVKQIDVTVTLNGENSHHTEYKHDSVNKNVIIFKYTGNKQLVGWDFEYNNPEPVEGVDYKIVSKDKNSITIEILGGYTGDHFWVNAVDTDSNKPTGIRNESQKSPDTGATALGLGIMLTGSAILVATRKKQNN